MICGCFTDVIGITLAIITVLLSTVSSQFNTDLFYCGFEDGSCNVDYYDHANITRIVYAKYSSPNQDITKFGTGLGHYLSTLGTFNGEIVISTPPIKTLDKGWKCLDFWFSNNHILGHYTKLTVYEGGPKTGRKIVLKKLADWRLPLKDSRWVKGSLSFVPSNYNFLIVFEQRQTYSQFNRYGLALDEIHVHDSPCSATVYPLCPNSHYYRCINGKCVFYTLTCDGTDHCGDFTDEAPLNKRCPTKKTQGNVTPEPSKRGSYDTSAIKIAGGVIGCAACIAIIIGISVAIYRTRSPHNSPLRGQTNVSVSTERLTTISEHISTPRRGSLSQFFSRFTRPPSYRTVFPAGPPNFPRGRRLSPPPTYDQVLQESMLSSSELSVNTQFTFLSNVSDLESTRDGAAVAEITRVDDQSNDDQRQGEPKPDDTEQRDTTDERRNTIESSQNTNTDC